MLASVHSGVHYRRGARILGSSLWKQACSFPGENASPIKVSRCRQNSEERPGPGVVGALHSRHTAMCRMLRMRVHCLPQKQRSRNLRLRDSCAVPGACHTGSVVHSCGTAHTACTAVGIEEKPGRCLSFALIIFIKIFNTS